MSEIKPYKTGWMAGIPIVKLLLHPSVKQLVDTMHKLKGSYVGISDGIAQLFVDNQPILKLSDTHLSVIKSVLDDVKEYHDITEYRLTPERYKRILQYYL